MSILKYGKAIGVLVVALMTTQQAGCMEHKMEFKVGDKTVKDTFANPQLQVLARAACEGNTTAIAQVIKDGADVNGTGYKGITPIFWAAGCRNLQGMEALLKAGANPNLKSEGGYSVVHTAVTFEDAAPLKLLLKYGGDPNDKNDQSNWTALEKAMSVGMDGGGWDKYYALLDAGADINRPKMMNRTIAIFSSHMNQYDKVAELLERGYKFDLNGLGRSVETGYVDPNSPQAQWQIKVKEMLEQRGVKFPVPPKSERGY